MEIITVQKIIAMIDHTLTELKVSSLDEEEWPMHDEYYFGATHTLNNLRDHLQSCIEAELNSAENETRE